MIICDSPLQLALHAAGSAPSWRRRTRTHRRRQQGLSLTLLFSILSGCFFFFFFLFPISTTPCLKHLEKLWLRKCARTPRHTREPPKCGGRMIAVRTCERRRRATKLQYGTQTPELEELRVKKFRSRSPPT